MPHEKPLFNTHGVIEGGRFVFFQNLTVPVSRSKYSHMAISNKSLMVGAIMAFVSTAASLTAFTLSAITSNPFSIDLLPSGRMATIPWFGRLTAGAPTLGPPGFGGIPWGKTCM